MNPKTEGAFVVLLVLAIMPVPAPADLAAVSGLQAEVRSYSKMCLSWDDPHGACSYNIHRSTTAGFEPDASNLVMRAAATVYQDLGLDPSTTYYYHVAAVDEAGNAGPASPAVSTTTTAYSDAIHPRLVIFPGDIPDLRDRCKNHEPWRSWYAVIKQAADDIYGKAPSREVFNARVDHFALFSITWLVEDTDRYFQKLHEALLDCPTSAEGENELSIGSTLWRLCCAYDIAWPRLTDAERANVEHVIEHWGVWLSARVDQHYTNWRTVATAGLLPAGLLLNKPLWVEQSVNAMDYTLSDQIVGSGSNVEGCGYGAYLLSAATSIMMMLKNAGVRDFYQDPRLMNVVRRRIQERLPWFAGNGYEDSPYYLSHAPFATAMFHCPMPAEARQMKTIFNSTTLACKVGYNRGEPENLLFHYYTDTIPEAPVQFTEWADPAAGIAYMGTGMGDEDFVISFNAKPYAITYANGHQRPDDLSFELAAYGAFLAHEPGYAGYAIEPYADYAHSSEAHSTFTIAGESQEISVENTGIKSFLSSDVLSCIEAVNDNGYSKGKASRTLLFVKPTAGERAYILLADDVDLNNENDPFTWYLHGGLSDQLVIDGRSAVWTVPRWTITDSAGDDVKVLAHMAAPSSAVLEERRLIVDGKDHYEFFSYVGYRSDRQHTKYLAATFNGSQNLLTAIYPYKQAWIAPGVEDIDGGVRVGENDIAAIQDASADTVTDGVAHDAKLMFLRRNGPDAAFFLAKDATNLMHNECGFRSSAPVQIICDAYSSASELQLHIQTGTPETELAVLNPSIGPGSTLAPSAGCDLIGSAAGKLAFTLKGAGQHRVDIRYNQGDVPATPENLEARPGLGQVVLTWHGAPGASRYRIKRATKPAGPFAIVDETTETKFTDNGLSNNVSYFYTVCAANENGESGPSKTVAAAQAVHIPSAPSALAVTRYTDLPLDEDYLVLDWTGSAGADYYIVKQVLNPERTGFKTVATNVRHPSEAFLAVDPSAELVVSAVNRAGESPNSEPACLTTPAYPGVEDAEPATAQPAVTFEVADGPPAARPAYGPWHFHRLSNGQDAHVTDGAGSEERHGCEGQLLVRSSKVEGQNARALIRFDLGNGRVQEPDIEKAVLKIHCVALDEKTTIQLLAVADDAWKETLVTWNTMPSGTLLAEQLIDQHDKAYEFDVTDYVRNEHRRDKRVSFMLVAAGDGPQVQFGAKEGDRGPTHLPHKRPALEITGKGAKTK